MPKSRQQTTPRQAPPRAAKRRRSEAADTPNASDSGTKTVSRRGATAAAGSSGKKQKVQAEQAEQVGVPANDKENTHGGSEPRRSTRTRTARLIPEVTPGPGLIRPGKDQGGSTGRGAATSTQKKHRQTSTGRRSSQAAQGQTEVASAEPAIQSDKGADPVVTSPQRTAPALQPDGSPLQELPAQLVPTGTPREADSLPSAHDKSSQVQASAPKKHSAPYQSPEQPVRLAPSCTHPSHLHNAYLDPQRLQSSLAPGGSALAAPSPAPGPSPAAADPILATGPVGVDDHSSQEGSRHSSGHSNDHPTALMARKHLSWDSTGPSSGPISVVNKPPLNKGAVMQPAQPGPSSPAAADADEKWWDPTDIHKVITASLAQNCIISWRLAAHTIAWHDALG